MSFYDEVGGHETFRALIAEFYKGVADDPLVRRLYPEEDLGPAEERFRLFIEQYWGGPTTYSDTRGHPRLRMRHAPFAIGPAERDGWLRHMRHAMDVVGFTAEQDKVLWDYFESAAHAMQNQY